MDIQKFKENLQKSVFGPDAPENKAKDLCIQCKQPAAVNCYSAAGLGEFKISGLCEKCFDDMFKEEE